jgi:hypothetical protein
MREPIYSGLFKRDVKRAEKRGKDMARTSHRFALAYNGRAYSRHIQRPSAEGQLETLPGLAYRAGLAAYLH